MATSCVKEVAVAVDTADAGDAPEEVAGCLVPGEIIVEFSEEFTALVERDFAEGNFLCSRAGEAADVFASLGVTSVTRLFEDGGEWEERHRAAGLHKWYRVKYDERQALTRAEESLSSLPGVVYLEPVRRIKSTATFNDPMLGDQWHYYNDGSRNGMLAGSDINVVPVWERYTTGSPDVIVSIVDGGIQMDHPDLAAAVVPAGANGSRSFVSGFSGYTIYPHDHGTHVAGTIGAINDNGIGVAGVAGGSDGKGGVRLMSCAVFKDNPNDPQHDIGGDTYNAMVWGADHGAVISQNSWGYVYENAADAKAGSVGSMKAAIDYFVKYAGCDKNGNQLPGSPMKGGVVIFSAGNDAWPDGWPAEYEACVAVGAFGADYARSYYSNYGDWVDICAPGGDAYKGYEVLSTVTGGSYGKMQGTSMACPHVSGVAALLVSYFGGQGFTNEMLLEKLLGEADNSTRLASARIGPKLDAFGAFNYGGTIAPDPVSSYSVSGRSNNLSFNWDLTADEDAPDGRCYSYLLLASKDRDDFENFKISSVPSTMKTRQYVVESDAVIGETLEAAISGLEFETDYYVAIIACDYGMNFSGMSEIKRVATESNNAPVIEADFTGKVSLMSHERRVLRFRVYDPDGHDFSVSYRPGGGADSFRDAKDGWYEVTIIGNAAEPGTYTGVISVTDNTGHEAFDKTREENVSYVIMPNHAPTIIKPLPGILMTGKGESLVIDISGYIQDEDGETLAYSVSHSNPMVGNINPAGNLLTLTSLNFGIDEVSVTATDCRGETCVLTFRLVVREPSSEADVYPSMVKDILTVSTGEEATTTIRIHSSSGQLVYESTSLVGAFSPAKIDMGGMAPGAYSVTVETSAKVTKRTIVKL